MEGVFIQVVTDVPRIRDKDQIAGDVRFLLGKRSSSALVTYMKRIVKPQEEGVISLVRGIVEENLPDYDSNGPRGMANAAVVLEWMGKHEGAVECLTSLYRDGKKDFVRRAFLEMVNCGLISRFLVDDKGLLVADNVILVGDRFSKLLDKEAMVEVMLRIYEIASQSRKLSDGEISALRILKDATVDYFEKTGQPGKLRLFILEMCRMLGEFQQAMDFIGTELPRVRAELLIESGNPDNYTLVQDMLSSTDTRFDTTQELLALFLYYERKFFNSESNHALELIIDTAILRHPEHAVILCVAQQVLNTAYPFGNPRTETEISDRDEHALSTQLKMVECALRAGDKSLALRVLDILEVGQFPDIVRKLVDGLVLPELVARDVITPSEQ